MTQTYYSPFFPDAGTAGSKGSTIPIVTSTTIGKVVTDIDDVVERLDEIEGGSLLDVTPPSTVTGLSVTSSLVVDTDGTQISVITATWAASAAADLNLYELEIAENGGGPVIFTAGESATPKYEWKVRGGQTFTVRVRAVDDSGNRGPWSGQVTVTSARDTTPPSNYTTLAATAGVNSIYLTWTNPNAAVDADLAEVLIYESTGTTAPATPIATVNAIRGTAGGYSRTGLPTDGASRYYWVKGRDSSGNLSTAYSNRVGPIKPASIVIGDFATGIRPIEQYATLAAFPAAGTVGRVAFNQADGKLYRDNGTAWVKNVDTSDLNGQLTAAQIGQNTVDISKLATGLTAVEIVNSLPTTGNYNGRTVVVSGTGKLWRYINGAYTAAVEATDVTGQIIADQIASQAVDISKFADGLQPIEKVLDLPLTGNYRGRIVFSLRNGKIFRWTLNQATGTEDDWTSAVPTRDLTGFVQGDQIQDNAISLPKFAQDLNPIERVDALPLTGNYRGRIVVLKSDAKAKMYRWNSTSSTGTADNWVNEVEAVDITGQITTTQIGPNAIKTGNLDANAVTAAKIAANTITATEIKSNTITSNEIKALSIIGDSLAVNTISASKIFIGETSNYVLDPFFLDNAYWIFQNGAAVSTHAIVTGTLSSSYGALIGAASGATNQTQSRVFQVPSQYMPVEQGVKYRCSLDWAVTSGFRGRITMTVQFYDSAKNILPDPAGNTFVSTDYRTTPAPTTGADAYGAVAKGVMEGQVQAPDNAQYVRTYIECLWPTTAASAGNAYVSRPIVQRAASGELIVDGAINADKLSANAVTAPKIAAGAITAEKIVVGSIGQGLVWNGGAEAGLDGWYFSPTYTGGTFTQNTAQEYAGDACFALTKSSSANQVGMVSQAFPVTPGKIYTFRLAWKGNAASASGAYLRISYVTNKPANGYVTDISGSGVGTSDIASNQPLTTSYVPIERQWTAPSSAYWVSICVINAGTGPTVLYVDDINCYETTTSAMIADGAIITDKIFAGAITSAKIATNSVTAGKIAIGDFDNLASNGFLEIPGVGFGSNLFVDDAAGGYNGSRYYLARAANAAIDYNTNENRFSVRGGEQFYLEWSGMFAAAGGAGTFDVHVRWNTQSGSQITTNGVGSIGNSATSWTVLSNTITAPANAVVGYVQIRWGNTAGEARIGHVLLRRKNTGNLLVDGIITTSKLASEAVEAGNIKSGTITATQIAGSTITANEIASGTITTGLIKAGAITAQLLALGDFENLALNGDFSYQMANWDAPANVNTVLSTSVDTYANAPYYMRRTATASTGYSFNQNWIPVQKDDEFFTEWVGRVGSGYTGSAYGVLIWYTRLKEKLPTGGELPLSPNLTSADTNWVRSTQSFKAPQGAAFVRVGTLFANTAGNVDVGFVSIRRKNAGNLIVDGTITGNKIASETIEADNIKTGTIQAAQLAAGSILAEKILIGSLGQGLVWNSGAEAGLDGWQYSSAYPTGTNFGLQLETASRFSGTNSFRLRKPTTADSAAANSKIFPIVPNKTYTIRWAWRGNQATASGCYVRITYFSTRPASDYEASGSVYTDLAANEGITTAWGSAREVRWTAPSNALWASIQFISISPGPAALYFDDVNCYETATSAMIGEGVIVAENIAGNTITGNKIFGGTITGDKISTSTSLPGTVTVGTTGVSIATMQAQAANSGNLTLYSSVADKYAIEGNKVTKTNGAAWDANIYSREGYTGAAAVTGMLSTPNTFLGLTDGREIGGTTSEYQYLDYAWHYSADAGGKWTIYENGTRMADLGTSSNGVTFNNTMMFSITYDGQDVRYYAGGALMRTTTTSSGRRFFLGVAGSAVGATVGSLNLVPFADNSLARNALAAISDIGNDNIITKGEKDQLITAYNNAIAGTVAALSNSSTLAGTSYGDVTAQTRTDLTNARDALTNYLQGLHPGFPDRWKDPAYDTPVSGNTLRSRFGEVYNYTAILAGNNVGTVIQGSANPAARINLPANTTLINPGKILVAGSTTLSSWRGGPDLTEINGGSIAANTISANKLTIGNRGIGYIGIDFSYNRTENRVYWTTGYIYYVNDQGQSVEQQIVAGNTGSLTAHRWLIWKVGRNYIEATQTNPAADDTIMLASWWGGNQLNVTYGGTIVDGDRISTGSIQADRLNVATLSAISANIGLLRTATSGARTEIENNQIRVYDSNGTLRVRMGVW